jgi:hypothetical protein
LVERLEDKAIDSLTSLEEAEASLRKLLQTPGIEGRSASARNVLLRVHERVDEFAQKYRNELIAYENLCSLQQLSTERGREWPSWCKVVREAIEACAADLYQRALPSSQNFLLVLWMLLVAWGGGRGRGGSLRNPQNVSLKLNQTL